MREGCCSHRFTAPGVLHGHSSNLPQRQSYLLASPHLRSSPLGGFPPLFEMMLPAAAGGWKTYEGHEDDPHDREHKIKVRLFPGMSRMIQRCVWPIYVVKSSGFHCRVHRLPAATSQSDVLCSQAC